MAAAEGAPLDRAAGRFLGVSTLPGSAAHHADGALDIEATGDRTGRWSAPRCYRVHYRQATGFQDPAQRQHPAAKQYLVSWTAGPAAEDDSHTTLGRSHEQSTGVGAP